MNDLELYAGMGTGILNFIASMQHLGHATVKGHLVYVHMQEDTPLPIKVLTDFARFAAMSDGWEESRDRLFQLVEALDWQKRMLESPV